MVTLSGHHPCGYVCKKKYISWKRVVGKQVDGGDGVDPVPITRSHSGVF